MLMTQRRLDRHNMRAINVSTATFGHTPILLALSAVSAHNFVSLSH
jgi:hypothetical protein